MKQETEKEKHLDQVQANHRRKNQHDVTEKGRIKVDFYTDPLCCWSWAFEKPWRQLLANYGDRISYRYVMGGMIRDWDSYNDAMNSVTRPLQMGPVWMHASEVTQVKMRYDIWHLDPPSSSYPACIAVKTAGLQSDEAGDTYLFEIRRSLMEEAANISKPDVLLSIAEKTECIDTERFRQDWKEGKGRNALREDLKKVKFHEISRFPSLTFTGPSGKGIMIVGYRPFDILEQAFKQVAEN